MGADGKIIDDTALTMDNYIKTIPLILQLPQASPTSSSIIASTKDRYTS
jgi:hypothetical protein